MNTDYTNIKIQQEDIFRNELKKHLKKYGLKESFSQFSEEDYNNEIKIHLKDKVELTAKTHPNLFQIIDEVCNVLDINLYVRTFKGKEIGGSENAEIISFKNNIILIFYNDILNLVDDLDELKFIIGHEFGHYIFGHTETFTETGIIGLLNKQELSKTEKKLIDSDNWDFILDLSCLVSQLAELNADRIGLIASKNFGASTTASVKLNSGSFDKYGFYKPEFYLEQAERLIANSDYFTLDDLRLTHPHFPLRTYALSKFYQSEAFSQYKLNGKKFFWNILFETFSSLENNFALNVDVKKVVPIDLFEEVNKRKLTATSEIHPDKNVETKILIKIISQDSNFKFEKDLFLYIALIEVTMADGKLTSAEQRFILSCIRDKEHLPKILDFGNKASKTDLENKFLELIPVIKNLPAVTKTSIIKNLIKVAKSDRKEDDREIATIFEIAEKIDATEQARTQLKNLMGIMIQN